MKVGAGRPKTKLKAFKYSIKKVAEQCNIYNNELDAVYKVLTKKVETKLNMVEHEHLIKCREEYESAKKELDFAIRINELTKNNAGSYEQLELLISLSDKYDIPERYALNMINKGYSVLSVTRMLHAMSDL